MPDLTAEQRAALSPYQVSPYELKAFGAGEQIVCEFQSQSEPGIAILQRLEYRLRCGIVTLRDPGGGLITLIRFRENARRLAIAFGLEEMELFGVEVINPEFEAVLRRQSFERMIADCPDELGGGTCTILTRVFRV